MLKIKDVLIFQTCTGLNNIEYLRQEMESLPELFELTEDDDAEQNFVIAKTSSKMEGSVLIFMDSVIRKVGEFGIQHIEIDYEIFFCLVGLEN